MDQKPQWDQLVPISYVPDIKGHIDYLKSLLGSINPRYARHEVNVKAAIALYENGYDGSTKIYLVNGK